MVRVNGQMSGAVVATVATVDTEVDGTLGMLFIDLDAPTSEINLWKDGQHVHVEVKWKPKYIVSPIHRTLIEIMGSGSVKGLFIAHTHILKDRLFILLQSAGTLKPLPLVRKKHLLNDGS